MAEIDIGPWKKEKKNEIKHPQYKDDESWDDMVGQGGYDPRAATASMPILRRLIGATSKEKRQFYTDERKRLQMLKDVADGKIVLKEEEPDGKMEESEEEEEIEEIHQSHPVKEESKPEISGVDNEDQPTIKSVPMERLKEYESDSEPEPEYQGETPTIIGEIESESELQSETPTIKSEDVTEEPEPQSLPVTVKAEIASEEQEIVPPVTIKKEYITHDKFTGLPVTIKQEPFQVKIEKPIKKEKPQIDDEIMHLYKKRQRDLQKIIKNLQAKEVNVLDPRLQVSEDGRLRERSLSPIFQDLQSDPRLRINPFSLMKGKENYRDPRLSSQLKKEQEKMKKVVEEEKLQEKQRLLDEEKQKEEQKLAEQKLIEQKIRKAKKKAEMAADAILGDIDILDQLIDEVENPKPVQTTDEPSEETKDPPGSVEKTPKVRLRSTSTCSVDSRESGEITDDSDDENDVIVIDDNSEDDLDAILNSADFEELKQCALTAKQQSSSDTEGSCVSMKRRSSSSDISPMMKKFEDSLEEIVQISKKVKQKF